MKFFFLLFLDINECEDTTMTLCANGMCVNNDGSYTCTCDGGFMANTEQNACEGNIFVLSRTLNIPNEYELFSSFKRPRIKEYQY